MQKRPDELNSWEYLKEHLYDKPNLYEASFHRIRPLVKTLKDFESLKHLLDFVTEENTDIRKELKCDLIKLDRTHNHLRPAIVEILMFILWDDLTERYGMGDRFADSYWDLIQELETTDYRDKGPNRPGSRCA